ncbi:O-antigen ligase family protein [Mycolicibacterium mengxianglii]|uniref:O-antigen ligase family protein n=1 Tax=Mycolicibacterium mengxianglii TaxID=2736649 RepID=UPI0018EF1A0C|nr:O-antigen ligase family protein [Mycolicibacterium mengxianglii]
MTISPLLVAVPLVGIALYVCASTVGLEAAFIGFAVVSFSIPTFLEGFSSAAAYLTLVSTFGLLAIAILNFRHIRVGTAARVGIGIALAVSVLFLLLNVVSAFSYAITGWVSLTLPVAAAAAGAGTFTALRHQSPERYSRAVKFILAALFVGIAANAALGLKQAFFGYTPYELDSVLASGATYIVGGQVRPIGGYGSSQAYGLYMALLVPFLLFYAASLEKHWRTIANVLGVVGLVGLMLSLLRGSMVGGLAAIAVGLLLPANAMVQTSLRRARWTVPLVLVGLGAVAITQSDNPRWSAAVDRLISIFNLSSDTSYNARVSTTFPRALAAFENNIWGLGGGASGPVSQTYPDAAPLGPLTTDNGYLNLGIQLGIVGGVFLFSGVLAILFMLLKDVSPLARSSALIIVALLVAMVFGGYWNLAGPMAVASIMVGLGIADSRRNATGRGATDSIRNAEPLAAA